MQPLCLMTSSPGNPKLYTGFYDGCGIANGNCEINTRHVNMRKYLTPRLTTGVARLDEGSRKNKKLVVLTQPAPSEYAHFLLDSISRLYWVHRHHPEFLTDENVYFHTGKIDGSGLAW